MRGLFTNIKPFQGWSSMRVIIFIGTPNLTTLFVISPGGNSRNRKTLVAELPIFTKTNRKPLLQFSAYLYGIIRGERCPGHNPQPALDPILIKLN